MTSASSVGLALCWLVACKPSTHPVPESSSSHGQDTAAASLPAADTARPEESTPSPANPCAYVPTFPLEATRLPWAPANEDFTFDDDGYMVGVSWGILKRTPYGGPSETLLTGLPNARGNRFLPDGSLVVVDADTNALLRIYPEGGRERIRGGLPNANGIAIGLDGMIYLTKWEELVRVDPESGESEVLAHLPNTTLDGITFNHDYSRLYFNQEAGGIFYVALDDAQQVTALVDGPTLPISPLDILDGMTADACGNVYVIQMAGELWQITPEGEVHLAADIPGRVNLPAANFGSGLGEWDPHTIYVSDYNGAMFAVEVGLPGKWEPHLPAAAVQP